MIPKHLPLLALALGAGAATSHAASLMLDFGPTANNAAYLTVSPGHDTGDVPGGETTWNMITTSGDRSDLLFSDGTAATGVTLNLGLESSGGSDAISYTTAIANVGLLGSSAALYPTGSIYGATGNLAAPGRDAFFGSGTAGATGQAVGLRVDGLAAGAYRIYMMGRNTNTATPGLRMDFYTSSGVLAEIFDFSALGAVGMTNPVSDPELTNFLDGINYGFADLTLGSGESLFLAVEGGTATELRGFLNMVQIVSVPEPGAAALAFVGLGLCLARRRRKGSA